MAPTSRSRRTKRPAKRPPPKKRASGVAAGKRRKRVAVTAAAPGMVEAALAAFAHEVRTPLTGILAISDLLATSDLDERERRWVDTIKAGAEHLASLATLFVDAARGGSAAGVRQDFFDLQALARKEMPTSYHLSAVVDDALQGVTDVVRGEDLFHATSVHRLLQHLLGLPQPVYRHHRLIRDGGGLKLSKSGQATGLRELRAAGATPADIHCKVALP